MFIVSFRLNVKKITIVVLVFLFIIVVAASVLIKAKDINIFNSLQGQLSVQSLKVRSNEERVAFLKQFGWEVVEKPIEIMEVQIPEELDQVYINYNNIQKEIGLDLEKYRGKRVKRYTYKVINHPTCKDDEVRANLFIYKEDVVAGDIMTTDIDGFMHSLLYPRDKNSP
ncbi:MAG: DUF4830 domain-containing protein [Clostridia bacterium]